MSRQLLPSVRTFCLCLIVAALCAVGGFITSILPASRAQEAGEPVLPRPFQRLNFISQAAPQGAASAPDEAAVAGAPIPTARDGQTATLLLDGRVLVVGGRDSGGNALASVQIFNPATGGWTTAGSLSTPRFGHTATMLQNGRVLVAGGQNSSGFLRSSEIFNPVNPAGGGWTVGPNLNTARARATATLLPTTASPAAPSSGSQFIVPPAPPADARVLVAGGENGSGSLPSAELFNPAANGGVGAWSNTAPMNSPRRDHTATLVRGGYVLVIGGRNGATPLNSVEMFFPNHFPSPVWSRTTDMSGPRYAHTTTGLNDGRVLVAGGHDGAGFLKSAALFDSNKRTWTAVSDLNTARRAHSATLLASGKVYIAGGFNGAALGTAETFDPATRAWTTDQLSAARSSHTATLLAGGSVLLVAGNTNDAAAVINSTELIDPAAGFWSATASNSLPLYVHSSVLMANGKVLSMGGLGFINLSGNISFISIRNAYLFDPISNGGAGSWTSTGAMNTDRYAFTATLTKTSEVLVTGGFRLTPGGVTVTNVAEVYDPPNGSFGGGWMTVDSMSIARGAHTATLLPDGRVLVTGGSRVVNNVSVTTNSVEIYEPFSGSWTTARSMLTARNLHTATLLADGRVLVVGGFSTAQNASLQSAEIYNPANDTWTSAGFLGAGRDSHTATLLPNGRVLVVGGLTVFPDNTAFAVSNAELYIPTANGWISAGDTNTPRFAHTATLSPAGKVLIAGGVAGDPQDSSSYVANAQVYDPATGAWRTTGSLSTPRASHTATYLPDGKVVVVGGIKGASNNVSNWLSSTASYDPGLGYSDNPRPFIAGVEWNGLKGSGSALKSTGLSLQGFSEASGGGAQGSATNYPLVQLRSLDSERVFFLPAGDTTGWSANYFTSRTITDAAFPDGFALLTTFTSGVPSRAQIIQTNTFGSTSQGDTNVGSIEGRVTTRAGTPLPNINIRLTRRVTSSCSQLTIALPTGADGQFSFPALAPSCGYNVAPDPISIGGLPVNFTPAQRSHFLPCNSCFSEFVPDGQALRAAPEQGFDTDNQQHVTTSNFVADFVANVTGRVTLAGTTSGIGGLPAALVVLPPVAQGDADRPPVNTSPTTGSFAFAQVALGGHYRLSVNNSTATNYEFTYSPVLGAPAPGNSVEIHEADQTEAGRDFVARSALATPVIGALGATTFTAGGPSFPLTAAGDGFTQNVTQLRWRDQPRATTVNSNTSLTAMITEQDIALGGTATVTISNQSGGETRTSEPRTVTINYPQPTINNLSPPSAAAGSGPLTLTLSGAGFFSTSQVLWIGQPRTPTFDPATRNLSITLSTADLSTPGPAEIRVSNLTPGGGESNARSFQITGYSIAGAVRFSYGSTPKLVPGVTVSLTGGSNPTNTSTSGGGAYGFTGLGTGPHVMTPSKTGDNNGIFGSDASLAAQAVAELINLSDLQRIAADANGSNVISGSDAALIARFVAEVSDPTSIVGAWKFNPSNRSYNTLNSNLTDQDFDAIQVGDVNGTWTPAMNFAATARVEPLLSFAPTRLFDVNFTSAPTPPKLLTGDQNNRALAPAQAINVSLPQLTAANGASLTIPITVGELTGRGVTAYDFTLTFDQNVLQLQNPAFDQAGTLSSAMSIVPNTSTAGRLRLVAFGISNLTGAGALLNLKFNVIGAAGSSSPLTLQGFNFNEGDPQANRINGSVTVPASPVTTTAPATEITTTSARLNGSVNLNGGPNGGATTAFFEWGANSDLNNPQTTPSQSIAAGNTNQAVSATLTGLNPGATYFFRLVASNSAGTTRGSILNFTTQAACPTITGLNPTSGAVGSNVTITGTNLTGITSVRFSNNVAATPVNLTAAGFNVVVPAGAVSGPIIISKTGCNDVQTANFTVLPSVTLSFGAASLNVLAGSSQTVALRLSAAQNSETVVTLGSANPAVAFVPATIPIPAGTTEVPINVTGVAVGGPVTITATLPAALGGANASLTINVVNTVVRIANASGAAGGTVSVPIELVSPGGVNALGFSLQFDPTILTSPQAALGSDAANAQLQTNGNQTAQGRLGLILAAPSGQQFAAGTRQIVTVSFMIAAGVMTNVTPLTFTGQPTRLEVSDANANIVPAAFIPGNVTITQGIEADVAPRPNGDGAVATTDWVQVGRFVAGLDTAANGSEYQRADCAPRDALGNGVLSVSDWVQSGRYAVGLDSPTGVGGPTAPAPSLFSPAPIWSQLAAQFNAASLRTLRLVNESAGGDSIQVVAVELDGLGGENAFGFSLTFDPTRRRLLSIVPGRDLIAARFLLNTGEAVNGRIGIASALPPAEGLRPGVHQLISITFASISPESPELPALAFTDEPIAREVSDAEANLLPVNFVSKSNPPLAISSAADFNLAALSSESLGAAFGHDLAVETLMAETQPLPTTLGGAQVIVRDRLGVERAAPLLFVSPRQINFQTPLETAPGAAVVTITGQTKRTAMTVVEIRESAPALFTADASGSGLAAGVLMRLGSDGSANYEPIAQLDPSSMDFKATPIDLERNSSEQVLLLLFATGVRRGRTMSLTIGGVPVELTYAGAQNGFAGLDQINIRLTREFSGRGELDLVLIVDGQKANVTRVSFK